METDQVLHPDQWAEHPARGQGRLCDGSRSDLSSRMPTEPPAKETVVVAFEQPGTVEE